MYKFINNIPYKYLISSEFDYSSESAYLVFLENKDTVLTEYIDYVNKDVVDILYKDVKDVIEKIDRFGLEKLDLIVMLVDRVIQKHNLVFDENTEQKNIVNFYQWLSVIQATLQTQVDENVSIIQAIELEKVALTKLKNEAV